MTLTLDTFLFWGDGGRGRGCEEPIICHLHFAAEVPDLCWVLLGPVESLRSLGVSIRPGR